MWKHSEKGAKHRARRSAVSLTLSNLAKNGRVFKNLDEETSEQGIGEFRSENQNLGVAKYQADSLTDDKSAATDILDNQFQKLLQRRDERSSIWDTNAGRRV